MNSSPDLGGTVAAELRELLQREEAPVVEREEEATDLHGGEVHLGTNRRFLIHVRTKLSIFRPSDLRLFGRTSIVVLILRTISG